MFGEREYQTEIVDAVFDEWTRVRATLVEAPTGTGKTVCFANVIKRAMPKRALVLANRNELIVQARDKIQSIIGRHVDIEKAELYAGTNLFERAQVVVSSIQTQCSGPVDNRRYKRFSPYDFSILIIDEAHHSVSDTYLETIRHYMKNENLKVLGVSATPKRTDEKALNQIYESVAYRYGLVDAIDHGWLVNIAQKYVAVKSLDFSHIKTVAGDLNEGQLSKVMEAEEIVQGVCQPTLECMFGLKEKTLSSVPVEKWKEILSAGGTTPLKTLVFTVSVEQAQMCASVFSRAMDGVDWVCGKTNRDKRSQMLVKFKAGQIHCLVNCGVLTEGFDEPGVALIVVARPTKSLTLYTQMIGRGTRPLPGIVDGLDNADQRKGAIAASTKKRIRIMDFAGNSGKHKMVSIPDVLGGHLDPEVIERVKKRAAEAKPGRGALISASIEAVQKEMKAEAIERERLAEEARKRRLLAKSNYSTQEISPFDYGHSKIEVKSLRSRDGRMFKEHQAQVLREIGCDPNRLTYRQGIAILYTKPRPKQLAILTKHGYDTKGLDFKQCMALIDELKQNGWKKKAA